MSLLYVDRENVCADGHRRVFLPLTKADKCEVCDKLCEETRLCSACGESAYCSPECQKKGWSKHKKSCGTTSRIELESFYPFLAFLASSCHAQRELTPHFALQYPIVNDVNPECSPCLFPDGHSAKLVLVDDRLPPDPFLPANVMRWFPLAHTRQIAQKLFFRVLQEGNVLPIVVAIALAILSEMYTTTSEAEGLHRRIRLKYKSSPIADFGVAKGRVRVTNQDRLTYKRVSDGSIIRGQNPDEHYWLWFKTIRGEEVLLDVGMLTFNLCTAVKMDGYVPPEVAETIAFAPAFFRERVMRHHTPEMHQTQQRLSVLKDQDLHEAIVHTHVGIEDEDFSYIVRFMERLAGRKITKAEEDLTGAFTMRNCQALYMNLGSELWKRYPARPPQSFLLDPEEEKANEQLNKSKKSKSHRRTPKA